MGKTAYDWWSYALRVLHKYPDLAKRDPASLSGREKRELAAVNTLLEELKSDPERLAIVQLRHFRDSHSLAGVAQKLHRCYNTVSTWNTEIIKRLGVLLGLEE